MMKRAARFIATHRQLVGWMGALLALGIATLYLFMTPQEASSAEGLTRFMLLYGHSICWALLAGASAAFALRAPIAVQRMLAYGALSFYALFFISLLSMQLR